MEKNILQNERPIFVSSIFKSGTKLLEAMIAGITRLAPNSPKIMNDDVGSDLYGDSLSVKRINFKRDTFFIWHNVMNERVAKVLSAENARPVLLVRNIYDLVTSQYYHITRNIDQNIGCSPKTKAYFEGMTCTEKMSIIINGVVSEKISWYGFGPYLYQIQVAIEYANKYPCHIMQYDNIVLHKEEELGQLADYLGIKMSYSHFYSILRDTDIKVMRKESIKATGSGEHFRAGVPTGHKKILKNHHYDMISTCMIKEAPGLRALCEGKFGGLLSTT